MEHNLENITKVLKAKSQVAWEILWAAEKRHSPDSEEVLRRKAEAVEIDCILRMLTDPDFFNAVVEIYEVTE